MSSLSNDNPDDDSSMVTGDDDGQSHGHGQHGQHGHGHDGHDDSMSPPISSQSTHSVASSSSGSSTHPPLSSSSSSSGIGMMGMGVSIPARTTPIPIRHPGGISGHAGVFTAPSSSPNRAGSSDSIGVITPLAMRHSGSVGLLPPSHIAYNNQLMFSSSPRPSEDRPIMKLSINLLKTFNLINQKYYAQKKKRQPSADDKRRGSVQSKEKKQRHNNGYDDDEYNYIIRGPGERLNDRYVVETQLGKGSFGRVVKCFDQKEQVYVAVKIVKSKQPFYVQAQIEIEILKTLNQEDAEKWNVVRLKDTFLHHNHQCLVFELLSLNLFDLLQSTNFKGVSLNLIAKFARQLLVTLNYLANKPCPRGNGAVGVIHCDLKPENILLRTAKRSAIKVIDFGSACFAHDKMYSYIQSRFYRAPEVLLGMEYGTPIDMWSLGCILVEMHTGKPLFDGANEAEQIVKQVEILGIPPSDMIRKSRKGKRYFYREDENDSKSLWQLKPQYPIRQVRTLRQALGDKFDVNNPQYVQFEALLLLMLDYNPKTRIKPSQARRHPFFSLFAESNNGNSSTSGTMASSTPMTPSMVASGVPVSSLVSPPGQPIMTASVPAPLSLPPSAAAASSLSSSSTSYVSPSGNHFVPMPQSPAVAAVAPVVAPPVVIPAAPLSVGSLLHSPRLPPVTIPAHLTALTSSNSLSMDTSLDGQSSNSSTSNTSISMAHHMSNLSMSNSSNQLSVSSMTSSLASSSSSSPATAMASYTNYGVSSAARPLPTSVGVAAATAPKPAVANPQLGGNWNNMAAGSMMEPSLHHSSHAHGHDDTYDNNNYATAAVDEGEDQPSYTHEPYGYQHSVSHASGVSSSSSVSHHAPQPSSSLSRNSNGGGNNGQPSVSVHFTFNNYSSPSSSSSVPESTGKSSARVHANDMSASVIMNAAAAAIAAAAASASNGGGVVTGRGHMAPPRQYAAVTSGQHHDVPLSFSPSSSPRHGGHVLFESEPNTPTHHGGGAGGHEARRRDSLTSQPLSPSSSTPGSSSSVTTTSSGTSSHHHRGVSYHAMNTRSRNRHAHNNEYGSGSGPTSAASSVPNSPAGTIARVFSSSSSSLSSSAPSKSRKNSICSSSSAAESSPPSTPLASSSSHNHSHSSHHVSHPSIPTIADIKAYDNDHHMESLESPTSPGAAPATASNGKSPKFASMPARRSGRRQSGPALQLPASVHSQSHQVHQLSQPQHHTQQQQQQMPPPVSMNYTSSNALPVSSPRQRTRRTSVTSISTHSAPSSSSSSAAATPESSPCIPTPRTRARSLIGNNDANATTTSVSSYVSSSSSSSSSSSRRQSSRTSSRTRVASVERHDRDDDDEPNKRITRLSAATAALQLTTPPATSNLAVIPQQQQQQPSTPRKHRELTGLLGDASTDVALAAAQIAASGGVSQRTRSHLRITDTAVCAHTNDPTLAAACTECHRRRTRSETTMTR